ncbi:hypothetical protein [Microlunatus parietis]|uniref:Uncharacterized protein n=1 Tax=Microlunatus parietis TaxID=682979 RepID=A0A7Y9IC82_9ACTN|nr:hypothetical protein [Microlunatus parietis]NYE74246.1 hypothetical protein [Microlunatus parietis]
MTSHSSTNQVSDFHGPIQVASDVQMSARDPQDFQYTPWHHDQMGRLAAGAAVAGC